MKEIDRKYPAMIYKQVFCNEQTPIMSDWYHTDKGKLFWFSDKKEWSCRDDRVSEQYPTLWYMSQVTDYAADLMKGIVAVKHCFYDNKILFEENKQLKKLADKVAESLHSFISDDQLRSIYFEQYKALSAYQEFKTNHK